MSRSTYENQDGHGYVHYHSGLHLNGEALETLTDIVEGGLEYAIDRGLLSGETAAEVEGYAISIGTIS